MAPALCLTAASAHSLTSLSLAPIFPQPRSPSHNAEPAESRSLSPLLALLTHRVRPREKKSERVWREERRKDRVEEAKGGRIKGLWNRNEAAGVLGRATAWAQLDPKGICEVNFRGSHGGHSVIFEWLPHMNHANMAALSCQILQAFL